MVDNASVRGSFDEARGRPVSGLRAKRGERSWSITRLYEQFVSVAITEDSLSTFMLMDGGASVATTAELLMKTAVAIKALLAEIGCDSDRFSERLLVGEILLIIPTRSSRNIPSPSPLVSTQIEVASSACSACLSSNGASPRVTTKPVCLWKVS